MLIGCTFTASAADGLLSRLEGEWIGRGSARQSPNAVPEQVYCRFTNSLAADGDSLAQNGRCAYGNQSGVFLGTLAARNGGYSGTWETPLTQGASTVTGSGSANRLTLSTRGVARETGEPVQAQITFELSGPDRYRMVTRGTDPDSGARFEVSSIVFTRAE